jgi:ketosteroid isomerase-like protein
MRSIGMTRLLGLTLVIAAASALLAAEPVDGVQAVAAGWREAVLKQDEPTLERLLADDLVYIHAGGMTQNKREYIAAVTKGPASHYETFKESDTKIRVYGETAVLTGFVDVKMVNAAPYRVRTLEVYVHNNGRWQLAQKESVRVVAGK